MKLTRAEQARLIEIEKWLVAEEVFYDEAYRVAAPILRRVMEKTTFGTTSVEQALLHVQLPLSNLKWLLALVKREVAGR